MMSRIALCLCLLFVAGLARAEGTEESKNAKETEKLVSGMSIVGNDEAPKSLVIVPWKSSLLGETLDVSKGINDSRGPVDREVFMRELAYYRIRVGAPDRRESKRK